MFDCRILFYEESWRHSLYEYLIKTFPSYSKEYIEYCLDHSLGTKPSRIIVNELNQIVGCHLNFCTKVLICGEEKTTAWGHDTFIDTEYRASVGLDLMLITNKGEGFGLGLSDVNRRIQKKLKKVFFEGTYNYFFLTRCCLYSPFQKLLHFTPEINAPAQISIRGNTFILTKSVDELIIPNNGFWYASSRDIDFVRDKFFLNQRFYKNKVFKYYVYALLSQSNPCYFVIRQATYRGIPALTLCDFRYNDEHQEMAGNILKAVFKIARQSHLGMVFFVCGDKILNQEVKKYLHYITNEDFISSGYKNLNSRMSFCITGADSDADFLR